MNTEVSVAFLLPLGLGLVESVFVVFPKELQNRQNMTGHPIQLIQPARRDRDPVPDAIEPDLVPRRDAAFVVARVGANEFEKVEDPAVSVVASRWSRFWIADHRCRAPNELVVTLPDSSERIPRELFVRGHGRR